MSDPELVAAISKLLAAVPGVTEKKTDSHVTFLAGKKVFAFTRGGGRRGVVLKLPKDRIAELLQREEIALLTMGKRTMKEWVLLDHDRPASYKTDLGLFKEAMAFVSSGSKTTSKQQKSVGR